MTKVILIIAVHPDDETLGCGGTILKHKENGDKVHWLILTSPTLNHPYGFTQNDLDDRTKILSEVSEMYQFDGVDRLSFPTQLLHNVDLREIIMEVELVVDRIKPNIIYMMFNHDVHSDHRVAFEAVYSCTKSFRKPFIEAIYMFETLSETEFAPAIQSTSFIPNVYVDITPYIKKKLEIMKLFKIEMTPYPYPRSISSIEALARVRGSRAGVEYAEAFMLLFQKI